MPTRATLIACAGVVASIAMSGCGGASSNHHGSSGNSPTASGLRLTPADYISKANAVCRAEAKKIPSFPGNKSGAGYETTASVVVPYLRQVLDINKTALGRLRTLRPPVAREQGHQLLLAAHQARMTDLNAALAAALHRDGAGFTAALQKNVKQDEPRYQRAAATLGLRGCLPGG